MKWRLKKFVGTKQEAKEAVSESLAFSEDARLSSVADAIARLIDAMPSDVDLVLDTDGALFRQNEMHEPDSEVINVRLAVAK